MLKIYGNLLRRGSYKHLIKFAEKREEEGDTWWWNEEVHVNDATARKKAAYKDLCRNETKENKAQYKSMKKLTKKVVGRAMRRETKQQLDELSQKPNNVFNLLRLIMCFVDLEKAFDRVPMKVMEWTLRKKRLHEMLVIAVMSLYEGAKTKVRVGTELSEEFCVKVGVHLFLKLAGLV